MAREMRAERPAALVPVQISVCTGRGCRMRWESPSLLEDLSRAAAMSGQAITVTSCRCLNMCDEGPVVVASPARGFATSTGAPAEQLFVNVENRDIEAIIAAVGGRGQ